MKPEYSYTISRTDRICLVAFIVILLSWEFVKYLIPEVTFNDRWEAPPELIRKQVPKDSAITVIRQKPVWKSTSTPSEPEPQPLGSHVKHPTDIMVADENDLVQIGFSKKTAGNIMKYKAAGGQLSDVQDVMKIYGMDSTQWETVAPFVLFPKAEKKRKYNSYDPNRYFPKRIIDLNTATITDLDSLPGIGEVLADRIIRFRNSLGGFYDVAQLRSCYGIPPETLEKILPMVGVIAPIRPRNVNHIDWKNFYHPYLKKKFIPMIIAYKAHHGSFESLQAFRNVFPPDTSWCDTLLPYLTFGVVDSIAEEEN